MIRIIICAFFIICNTQRVFKNENSISKDIVENTNFYAPSKELLK